MQDGLGSVRQLVVGERVLNSYGYTAWGVPLQWRETIHNRYTFTSREHNPETDLYDYRFRHYHCQQGRFLSRDPFDEVSYSYRRKGKEVFRFFD